MDKLGDGRLQDFLAVQLAAVKQVLVVHQEITKCLAEAGLDVSQLDATSCINTENTILGAAARNKKPLIHDQQSPPISRPLNMRSAAWQSELKQPLISRAVEDASLPANGSGLHRSAIASSPSEKAVQKLVTPPSRLRERLDSGSSAQGSAHNGMSTGMFPNQAMLKQRLLKNLQKPQYNVEDLYHKDGCCQRIARDSTFQNGALVVIVLNVLWIAIDTDYNHSTILSEAPPIFQIVNNIFTIAFVTEILIRFLAFAKKSDCLGDGWFVFDATLVCLMVWETWIEVALDYFFGLTTGGGQIASVLRIFRMLRLTRVARLARLFRNMPELLILIRGMAFALKSVMATLFLLLVIIYIFAVLFTQQLAGTELGAGIFDNVPQAMNFLMVHSVFPEEKEWLEKMLDEGGIVFYSVAIVYLMLASLTVLNMLIGVLCEVISVTAKVEHEEMTIMGLQAKMIELLPHLDRDDTSYVSKETFRDIFEIEDAVIALHSVGVDVGALVDFADLIYGDRNELPMSDLLQKVLQFRTSNHASARDAAEIRITLLRKFNQLQDAVLGHVAQFKTMAS